MARVHLRLDDETFWSLSPREFDELVEVYRDAEKQRRFDLWVPSAQISAMLFNINRDKKHKPAKYTDFMPEDLVQQTRSQGSNTPTRINTKDSSSLQNIESQAKALKIFAGKPDLE